MDVALNVIMSAVGIAIGVTATVLYGSTYFPRHGGKAREKYMVTEIFDFRTKNDTHHLARVQLVRSSLKNACGFADLVINPTGVEFLHYAFANNCFHCVVAPGKVLVDDNVTRMNAQSNQFTSISITKDQQNISRSLIPPRYQNTALECMLVTLEYQLPKTYTGPLYKTKNLLFAKGIGLLTAVAIYSNGQEDVMTLKKHRVRRASQSWWPVEQTGNYWVYDVNYQFGPNKVNLQE